MAVRILFAASLDVKPLLCPLSSFPYGWPLAVNAFLPTSVATLPGAIYVTWTLWWIISDLTLSKNPCKANLADE